MNSRGVACLVLGMLWIAIPATADDWGHWRGPTGNGASLDATPPTVWSATENVKWKTELPGRGSGSPVVWKNRVFVTSAIPADDDRLRRSGELPRLKFVVFCIDRDSGELVWERVATVATPHQETHSTNGFASASPCTDGEHVYAHFGSRGLYCYTMTGDLVWKRDDLGRMMTRNGFGEGSSPTIAGELLIVPWDHEGPSYLAALDKRTGNTVWKTPRDDEPSCWATPLIIDYPGGQQIVMNGQTYARGYDLKTGKELWRCGGQTQRPVASAVAGDGLVFVGSGFRGSFLAAFRPDGRGDIGGTEKVVWSVDRDTPDIASPLLSGNRLYFHKGKSGLLSCFDSVTGRPHYTAQRIPGINSTYASPVAAGGHVFLTGRSGTTVVIRDSDQLEIVATNSVGEGVDATPAAVDDQLFIRGQRHLFCISR
jgi:outer membrane protein assembly factor BamB